jgi:hypothetical protein
MANTPVPVLGTQSFVYDSANKFNQLLSDFYLSDYNQTQLYPGQVTSLPRILQQAGSDYATAVSKIQSLFSNYLSRYYDGNNSVQVSVVDDTAVGRKDQLILKLVVSLTEDSQQVTYGYLLKTANAMIEEVVRINNYGT